MKLDELKEKLTGIHGLIISIVAVLGLSFSFHTWMTNYFVTSEQFDNSVKNLEDKLDNDIAHKMDKQFLVLRKNIRETEYNVLGAQLAGTHVKDKFDLKPFELDNITKMVRKHCMIGKSLGYMPKDTDCEDKVEKKLNGGL